MQETSNLFGDVTACSIIGDALLEDTLLHSYLIGNIATHKMQPPSYVYKYVMLKISSACLFRLPQMRR